MQKEILTSNSGVIPDYSQAGQAKKLWSDLDQFLPVNPKGGGGGPKVPSGFSIGCHFSQDDAMVTKILDFIHIHPK